MVFGVTVGPEIFQGALREVLSNCLGTANISDNIIIHGKGIKEHNDRLEKVLTVLGKRGLTLNKKKCRFAVDKSQYMGYVVSKKGFRLEEGKVKAVEEARAPVNVSELRSFLGLVNFCAKFTKDVTKYTEPLRVLLCKNVAWEWNDKFELAFRKLKDVVAKSVLLNFYKKNRKTKLIVDAGPFGAGAVLTQEVQKPVQIRFLREQSIHKDRTSLFANRKRSFSSNSRLRAL